MCLIEDNTELNRILETTKYDKFQLVDLPLNAARHVVAGVTGHRLAPANDTACIHVRASTLKGSNGEQCTGVDPCQGLMQPSKTAL